MRAESTTLAMQHDDELHDVPNMRNTIRSIPDALDRAVRQRARQEAGSLNTVVEALARVRADPARGPDLRRRGVLRTVLCCSGGCES